MKKILFLAAILFSIAANAQKITIDIDSLVDNQTTIVAQKWNKSKDSVRVVKIRVNGQVYGDSTLGNCNITLEWRLDTANAVKVLQKQLDRERKAEAEKVEAERDKFYRKNPDLVKPKDTAKVQQPQALLPKSYDVIVKPPIKKRKWYQKWL